MKVNVLSRLNIITAEPTELADLGNCKIFTTTNDFITHIPHVHVCVKITNSHNFTGKPLHYKNKSSDYITLVTVGLKYSNEPYTFENLDVEEAWKNDTKTGFNKILKTVINWLNSWDNKMKMRKADVALLDYFKKHESQGWLPHKQDYEKWIQKLKNGTAFPEGKPK